MTKFEEELNKIEVEVQTPLDKYIVEKAASDESLYAQHYEAVLEKFKDWHSDEDYQRAKRMVEHVQVENEMLKAKLKSQLQQQVLPVVPECVAGAIESIPDHYSAFEAIDLIKSKVETLPEENKDWLQVYNWLCEGVENQNIFALAFITGKYEVEKPQLFYLKHIDMSKQLRYCDCYLVKEGDGALWHDDTINKNEKPGAGYKNSCYTFTQQEIVSMQTGSYEQIEVAE